MNEEFYKSKLWLWCSLIIPYLIIFASSLVIIGWFIKSYNFVSFLDTVPMQFNTALCLLLCAIGLLALAEHKFMLSRLCALLVIFISLLTLLEYLFSFDLNIDTLFIDPFTNINTLYIGRMAPNTALALFILSSCLSSYSLHKNPQKSALIYSLLISFSLAISIGALIGYLLGIETAYAWNQFHRMTLACVATIIFAFRGQQ